MSKNVHELTLGNAEGGVKRGDRSHWVLVIPRPGVLTPGRTRGQLRTRLPGLGGHEGNRGVWGQHVKLDSSDSGRLDLLIETMKNFEES